MDDRRRKNHHGYQLRSIAQFKQSAPADCYHFWYSTSMKSLITRACLHPIDYSGALTKRKIIFKEKVQESPGIYSFIFDLEKPCTWQAGQHAIFTLPGKQVQGKTWRPFSVASSPCEGVIRIGTNVPAEPSDFKKKLMELRPGEEAAMYGPFGEFHRGSGLSQIVGIAGGIGITPFRSLIADIVANQDEHTNLTLIYSAKDSYTYQAELDKWAEDPRINIIYTHTPDEVNAALTEQINTYRNRAHYFIAGPPGMIEALRKTLQQKGIKKIVNDPFKGY